MFRQWLAADAEARFLVSFSAGLGGRRQVLIKPSLSPALLRGFLCAQRATNCAVDVESAGLPPEDRQALVMAHHDQLSPAPLAGLLFGAESRLNAR